MNIKFKNKYMSSIMKRWFFTINHKRIVIMYMIFGVLNGFVSILLSGLMRLELSSPGTNILFGNDQFYNAITTMHGVLMLFLVFNLVLFYFSNIYYSDRFILKELFNPSVINGITFKSNNCDLKRRSVQITTRRSYCKKIWKPGHLDSIISSFKGKKLVSPEFSSLQPSTLSSFRNILKEKKMMSSEYLYLTKGYHANRTHLNSYIKGDRELKHYFIMRYKKWATIYSTGS